MIGSTLRRFGFFVGAVLLSAESLIARQMLYCYDFDIAGSSYGLYTDKSNKGTGTLTPTRKVTWLDWTSSGTGVFGSPHALLEKNKTTAIWIGDGSNSIDGCSGKTGFTISFWAKMVADPGSYTDFFGFRFGGKDLQFEYGLPVGCVKVYGASGLYAPGATEHKQFDKILPKDEWTHFCLVWNFNRPGIDLYIGGEYCGVITHTDWTCASMLQWLYIGSYVKQNGNDRTQGVSNTALDDFALFDFSATPDQVRWLGCHHPALPPEGPGRDMPYRFSFDRKNGDSLELASYGSGRAKVEKYGSESLVAHDGGAWGSAYAMELSKCNSIGVYSSDSRGLGASVGTGFTFSIWVYGQNPKNAWGDFWGMSIGSQHIRGEWTSNTSPSFTYYGNGETDGDDKILTLDKMGEWNNLCYVWNSEQKQIDVYLNGRLTSQYWTYTTTPTEAEALARLEVGFVVVDQEGSWRGNSSGSKNNLPSSYVDEAALFNYSFSQEEIAEMIKAPPVLPSFVATNLSRTVSADGVWQGFNANWTVGDTTRRLMWPAWEDMDVKATLTIAENGLALTNDSFVTCTSLHVANGTDTPSVRLAVPQVKGAIFEPQALTLGDGVELVLPLGCSCTGALTFGTNAKLVIDASDYAGATTAFSTGSFVLPEGDSDVLAHTALINGEGLVLALSADGKKILVQPPDTVPATAVWTNKEGDGDITKSGNWLCRNAAGATLDGEMPQARTVIQLSGNTDFSLPTGALLPHLKVVVTGDVTLTADCDWRGLGGVWISAGCSVDVKGFTLTVDELAGEPIWNEKISTVTSSSAGGVLDVVAEGDTTLDFVRFAGSLKLVKSGAGMFTLTMADQTYTGGTEVKEGTLKYGTASFPAGPLNAIVKVDAGATLDMNGQFSTSKCVYAYDLAGTLQQIGPASDYGWKADGRCFGDITLSGDVTIVGKWFYFANPQKSSGTITFNGHTLTLKLGGYVGFGAWRDAGPGGTLNVVNDESADGALEFLGGYGLKNTRLTGNVFLWIKTSVEFGDFAYDCTSWANNENGSGAISVFGTYTATAMRPPLVLEKGATLDLSQMHDPWTPYGTAPAKVSTTRTEAGLVTFADDATITVSFDKKDSRAGKVVDWAGHVPSNLNTLTFKLKEGLPGFLIQKDDGLYIQTGLLFIIR